MPIVEYLPGDGTRHFIAVKYIADFPRGYGRFGCCAFCHGDPCAEGLGKKGVPARIKAYFERNPKAETCPMCKGAPT